MMGVLVVRDTWEHSRAAGTALLVQLALADNASDETSVCWPSIPTLARKTRTSKNTVLRALRELVDLGEVSIEEPGGGRRSNRYLLRSQVGTGPKLAPVPDVNGSGATVGTAAVPPVAPEPLKNHQRTTTSHATTVASQFATLWERYPLKRDKDKALRAYSTLRRAGTDHETIAGAVERYLAEVARESWRTPKYLATFLGRDGAWRKYLEDAPADVDQLSYDPPAVEYR